MQHQLRNLFYFNQTASAIPGVIHRFAKTAFAVALACLVATPALALDLPKQAGTDHRIRYANYDPHNVTQLDSVIGVGTMIELEEGENYLFHVFGDSEAYEFTEYTNHLFLKPVVDQADESLRESRRLFG
ncbi:trwF protein [Alcaligenes faecalis subsp. faecalis NCIB 8687]|nr:trwF protein [Alcaligenes faecalis subsp. faecalis NCIB 8687]